MMFKIYAIRFVAVVLFIFGTLKVIERLHRLEPNAQSSVFVWVEYGVIFVSLLLIAYSEKYLVRKLDGYEASVTRTLKVVTDWLKSVWKR